MQQDLAQLLRFWVMGHVFIYFTLSRWVNFKRYFETLSRLLLTYRVQVDHAAQLFRAVEIFNVQSSVLVLL